MKALVTGGAGFIGSHIVERLMDDGHDVIVIDNFSTGHRDNIEHLLDKVKLVVADISYKNGWESYFRGIDWVFHFAALADIVPSIKDPEAYFKSNVDGTFNVMQASNASKIKRFIYAASSSCYGLTEIHPTPESAPRNPQYPYALTKMLGEDLTMHWAQLYQFPAVSLRFFNVYGPRSRTSGTYGAMFGVFLAQKLAGKPFTVVGDGTQTRDFTYVSDAVEAIVAAASSDLVGQIYNVGSGHTVSVNKIVELLGGDRVHIPKRPGEPECTFADISLIKKQLNWIPKITIEDGVSLLLDNIDYWKSAPVWEPNSIAEATRDWFHFLGKGTKEDG